MPDNRTQQQKELGWLLIDTAMKNIDEKNSGFADDNVGGDLSNEYSCIAICLDNCGVQVPALSGDALQAWLTDLLDNPENPDNQCVTDEYDANCQISGTGCIPLVLPGQVNNEVVIPNQQQLTTLINNYIESRQESYEIQVRTIYTKIGLWTDKYITNHEITFNDYFWKAVTDEVLPSVDWWSGGVIFNKAWSALDYAFGGEGAEDLALLIGRSLNNYFNSSSTENAKSGASLFNAEVRKLSPDQVFQVPTPLSDNDVGYWGLTTHFATTTNQQKTDMGETLDGFLDEQHDPETPFDSVYAACCGGAWCTNIKSDTARRKEQQLKDDKHNMEKGNYVEAYLLEGERDDNIGALLENNNKTSPNVEIDPAAYSAELTSAAAGLGGFASWFRPPNALSPTQQLAEMLSQIGKGCSVINPYNVTLTNGEVTVVTTKLLNKSVTFRKSSGGEAAKMCAAAEEKILRNQIKSWGGEALSPNFFKEGAPGFLEYANGTKWTSSQSPTFCQVFVKDEFGKITEKRILNGDLFALCKKIQATIDANIAKSAAAIAAASEEGTLLNLSEEFTDDVNLVNPEDAGSTLGREEVHVSKKQGPQAIQQDFNDVAQGTDMCEKPKPENCKSRSVKTVTRLDGDPNQRLDGFSLEDASAEEIRREAAADKVVRARTTQKGIAKPINQQPVGKAIEESAACRNNRRYLEELKRIDAAFKGEAYQGVKFSSKYIGDQVWKSRTINLAKQAWKQLYQIPLAGMVGWLSADYIAQKNCLADQLSEATGINRLKKAADAYNCETDAGVKKIVDEWVRNNPGFSPQPNVSCSTRYYESNCSVCSECKNNCGSQVLRSCSPLQSGNCASNRKCMYVDALTTCTTPFYQNVNDSSCVENTVDSNKWWYGQSVPLKKSDSSAVQEFWNDPPKYFPW